MRRFAVALLHAVAVLVSREATAAGFALRENSATGLGTAFAGAASSASDVSTIFNNPAGMTKLPGSEAGAVLTVIYPSIHFRGTGTAGGGDGGDAGGANLVPALYAMYEVSPDWKVGLAVTSPFGLKTRYNSDWVGRYLGINTSLKTIDVNPNVAYRVNDWFSVGGGFSAQYLKADEDKAIDFSVLGAPDGRARTIADGVGWGYNLGFLLEPRQGTRVGLTYRSRIENTLDGHEVFYGVPAGLPGGLASAFTNASAELSLTLPDNAIISATHKVTSALTVMSDVQWTHWSTFDDVRIVPTGTNGAPDFTHVGFRDTVFVSLGASYRLSGGWTLRGGVAYDQSPVRREFRTVRVPDDDEIIISVGASYEFGDSFRVDIGYIHRFINDAGMNDSINASAATSGNGASRIFGSFDVKADELSIAARLKF
jgi:long-chain fatty acid transport protein